MGCGGSKVDSEAKNRSDAIEAQLKKDRASLRCVVLCLIERRVLIENRNEVKILLLGAGESGKSTVLRQFKLIHEGSYTEQEREAFREIIYSNTIQSMHVIIDAMDAMNIQIQHQDGAKLKEIVMAQPHQIEADYLEPEVTNAIYTLWNDPGVKACYARSREYQLNDSASYYFDAIQRIGQRQYMPTDQDVLRSRVKTTGITETVFNVGELKYRFALSSLGKSAY